jgi:hypothetical protein
MGQEEDAGLAPGEYAEARRRLGGLLEEMGLADFGYVIEPDLAGWSVMVECAAEGEWQCTALTIEYRLLATCEEQPAARRALLAGLERQLGNCKRSG